MFHLLWVGILHRLYAEEEYGARQYIIDFVTNSINPAGLFTAPWQSHINKCAAGYSTFSNNVIESLWAVFDRVLPDNMPMLDVLYTSWLHLI